MAFVFDDQALIDRCDERADHRPWLHIRCWWRAPRALTLLADEACMHWFGVRRAWPWHVLNGLIHAANVILVAVLFGGWPAALFCVHPISGGLSIYVQLRADLLMTLFALLAAVFAMKGGIWWAGFFACLWLARSSKACGILAVILLSATAWALSART